MKFTYIDESGDKSHGDVFVMAGLLVDAYRLRTCTTTFDEMIKTLFAKRPNVPQELKTSALINGDGGWSRVDAGERKQWLADVLELASQYCSVFAIAFSFENFDNTASAEHKQPFGTNHWLGAAMFIAALVQKRMQTVPGNKGLTVLIYDDNKFEMQGSRR